MQTELVTRAAIFSLFLVIPLAGCATPAAKSSTQASNVLREIKAESKAKASASSTSQTAKVANDTSMINANGAEPSADWRADMVMRAMTLLGVSYKFGGNSPDVGLDCSGFVRLVVKDVLGKVLPRRAEEISHSSEAIKAEDLKPGDLVFFNTLKRTFSHVGIYVGNNQFIHSPSAGSTVRIETLDKQYWTSRFDGARRLVGLPDRLGADLFKDASVKEAPMRSATDRVGQ
jgi:cell wall-associated NlpC family hydrolase